MLTSTLLLGFVIGMQHAFEADHLAAVSALVSRRTGWRAMTRRGALWGGGHTLALLVISGLVLFTPWTPPERFESMLEKLVGLVLVGLGGHLLYRLWRDRVHVHVHQHDGQVHLHAHSHRDDSVPHSDSEHEHEHPSAGWRSLLVGLTHGAAGSAALIVFIAASLDSPLAGLAYVLVFGMGSIAGMVALTAVLALPLTSLARRATFAHRTVQLVIGLATIGIGIGIVASHAL